ncbi:hypothetical protein QA639_28870 [Bradyrhizobium pachyrhizi]|uniref:hypothetical protein n=1 Tax=Bradyrhizobium pachyrhizi TaxID=280333 RepID=UPI0024B1F5F2|nr:hypothetical protein [Bradyrhizobium pachyrhizi]WFU53654.1 hypothetical protein QA639_28870 [Bradyrhizobium pachyrhizi]
MDIQTKAGGEDPLVVTQFYYSQTFPYLMMKHHAEIRRRLVDVPRQLRQRELAPQLIALGEAAGDPAWLIYRAYLDKIEAEIATLVCGHSPGFWFHLHRRLRPMLAEEHGLKNDATTVLLVRRIAELAYAKHGALNETDDLGPVRRTRLQTLLDGAWYEAMAEVYGGKLKAKKAYQALRETDQIVMTDFRRSDLIDVFAIEGLCYEYWWASAAMRSIGKGSIVKWDATLGSHRYKDSDVNPLSFELYDERNAENFGFRTRLGTWLDEENAGEAEAERGDTIKFAQMKPNPKTEEYPAWDSATGRFARGYGATNFEIGTFSLAQFRNENAFMVEPFKLKYGIDFDAVLFAVWAAAFFGTYVGITMHHSTWAQSRNRTMSNFTNLMFRGYTMVNFDSDELANEAVWFAKQLGHEKAFAVGEVRKAVEFISLSETAQKNIGLWSGGKRPILIPSMGKLMIDLAAILPALQTIFVGLRKAPGGGVSFENAVRKAIRARGLDLCLEGDLKWKSGNPREVDAAVRIGDRLVLIECFSYEMPLDFEVGKPSVFDKRKKFIVEKLDQAQSLAERVAKEPKGTNFDVSWAKSIEWRVVSPFVEFAWQIDEPLYDEAGVPRMLQVHELLDHLTDGRVPTEALVPLIKEMRKLELQGIWY